MPCHEYTCPDCKAEGDRVVSVDARDAQVCDALMEDGRSKCQAILERVEVSLTSPPVFAEEYGALMGDGSVKAGKFGESYPKKGPRRRIG